MTGEQQLSHDAGVDLGGILASLWRRKFPILLAGLIAAAIAFVVVGTIKPRYMSQASLLIQHSDAVLTRNPENASSQPRIAIDDQTIASQVELLQSQATARNVIKELKLESDPEFNPDENPSIFAQLLDVVGLKSRSDESEMTDHVLEGFFERLSVYQLNRARLIVIEFWSHDPKLAAAVPNAVAKEHVKLQKILKRGVDPVELAKLEPELNRQREKVLAAEAKVAEYRTSAGLLIGQGNGTLAEQDLNELSTELSRVRAQLSRAQANAKSVERALSSGALGSATSVLQSSLIQRLRERQINLNSELAELNIKLLPRHPKVQGVKSQISNISTQINSEMRKILNNLQGQVRIDEERRQDLMQRRNVLKAKVATEKEETVQLRALQREAEAETQLLNAYLIRFKEAKSRQSREFLPADAKIVSQARATTSSYFPKKAPIVAGAFFGASLLASMVVLLAHALGSTAKPTLTSNIVPNGYVEERHNAGAGMQFNQFQNPYAAQELHPQSTHVNQSAQAAPTNYVNAPPLAPDFSGTQQPDELRSVELMDVARSMAVLDQARVAVVSLGANANNGGAVALARLLATMGGTILVDLRGDAQATQNMLGTVHVPGMKNLLSGSSPFANTLHIDRISDAHIVPVGTDMVATNGMQPQALPQILEILEASYRYVIIDAGEANLNTLKYIRNHTTGIILNADQIDQPVINFYQSMMNMGIAAPVLMKVSPQVAMASGVQA